MIYVILGFGILLLTFAVVASIRIWQDRPRLKAEIAAMEKERDRLRRRKSMASKSRRP